MELKNFFLTLSIILSLFTSLGIFLGSEKKSRRKIVFLILSILFSSIYSGSILIFQNLSPENSFLTQPLSFFIFLSPLLMDIFLLEFLLSEHKILRMTSLGISLIYFIIISVVLLNNPSLFYIDFSLSTAGNSITITNDFLYCSYIGFFVLYTLALIIAALPHLKNFRITSVKDEIIVVGIGIFLLRVAMLIFGMILPLKNSNYLWLAPTMTALMVVLAYYAILKHQIIVISKKWLKFTSYVVLITTAAATYMLLFYIIVTYLFKLKNLSSEIFILNFIMVAILFLILPILNEFSQFIHSLIKKDEEYLAYLIKRMNKMYTNIDADKLANFVAKNLHFSYIGIVIDGKIHGSKTENFEKSDIALITALAKPEHGAWQKLDEGTKLMLSSHKIAAVAAMRDAKGGVFGQMLVGLPRGKDELDKSDLEQLEQIVNLIAAMIDSRAKKSTQHK